MEMEIEMKIEIGVVSGCWQAKCWMLLNLPVARTLFFCEWKNSIKIKSNKYKDESIEDIKTEDKRWKKRRERAKLKGGKPKRCPTDVRQIQSEDFPKQK